jgi:L-fucose isomerase-like protein
MAHVRPLDKAKLPAAALRLGEKFARKFRANKAILGVFDEGCMGMFNAIVPDELLNPTGVYKERLSQSTLFARMNTVSDADARSVYDWYKAKGVRFEFGPSEENDLTEKQVLEQCKMYIAAVRIADDFGCATIGIQYQQGLKDLAPASDLAEGTLNNVNRPPVFSDGAGAGRELFKGEAIPHFNEVDECAGLDGLITYRLWRELGFPPENTLHDLRWGRHYQGPGAYPEGSALDQSKIKNQKLKMVDAYVWVFEISGAVPPEHLIGGWAGVTSARQPGMYFRLGGGTIKGISKPGHIVWSRIYIEGRKGDQRLIFDTGLGEVVELPLAQTQDRWNLTTSQWPIMHAVLPGISRDQMMAKHQSNHIQVAYAPTRQDAIRAMAAKAGAMRELGLQVNICGTV